MEEKKTTSFDSAEQGTFGDILNTPRHPLGKIRVGLIACGYFEYWRMYPALRERVEKDIATLHGRLAQDLDIVFPGMADTLDAAESAGQALAEAGVDIVIVAEGTYLPDFMVLAALEHVPNAKVILFNTQSGASMSPQDVYEDTLRNSALIGIAQLSGTFRKSGRPFQVVVGEISEAACYERITDLVRAQEIAKRLRRFNIGLVGHVFRGMFDLEFDRGQVRGCLGPEVITIQAEHLVDIWREIQDSEVSEATKQLTGPFSNAHGQQRGREAIRSPGVGNAEIDGKVSPRRPVFFGPTLLGKNDAGSGPNRCFDVDGTLPAHG